MGLNKRRFRRGDENHVIVTVMFFLKFLRQLNLIIVEPTTSTADFVAEGINGDRWAGQIKTLTSPSKKIAENKAKIKSAIDDIEKNWSDYENVDVIVAAINAAFTWGDEIVIEGDFAEGEIFEKKRTILFSGTFKKEDISEKVFSNLKTDSERSLFQEIVAILYDFIHMMSIDVKRELVLTREQFLRATKAILAKRITNGSITTFIIDYEVDKKAEAYINDEIFSNGDSLQKIERIFRAKATDFVDVKEESLSFINDVEIQKYFWALIEKSAKEYIMVEEMFNEN